MKEIKIEMLTLENFKCHNYLEIDFHGADTAIYGDNASGKTSVYDALIWLLFGKDSLGNSSPDIKPLGADGEVIDHQAITSVTGAFTVDGEPLTLQRTFAEVWAKKRGCSELSFTGNISDYYIDSVPVKKNAFDAKIKDLVPEDLFRMLTSVSYFAADLKWQTRRGILFDMSGAMTDTEIMAKDPKYQPLADAMGRLDLAGYKAMISSKRKQHMGVRNDTPARISECQHTLEGIADADFDLARAKAADLQEQIDQISVCMTSYDDSMLQDLRLSIREKNMELADLEAQNREYRMSQDDGKTESRQLDLQISDCMRRIDWLQRQITETDGRSVQNKRKVQSLREMWTRVNGEAFTGGVCPTCGQELPFDILQKKSQEFDAAKKTRLDEITKTAAELTGDIDTAKVEIDTWQKEIQEQQAAMEKAHGRQKELSKGTKAISDMPGFLEKQAKIEAAINELQAKAEEFHATKDARIGTMRDERQKLEQELTVWQSTLAKENLRSETEARIAELREDAKKASEALEEIDSMLFLIEEFTRFKSAFTESSINSLFQNAQFRLFRPQANGGLEERCDVVYDGVPYAGLNNGMRTNIGIDIINALSRHYGVRVPLFIDNAEAVTQLAECNSQTIRLVVSAMDKELRYEN